MPQQADNRGSIAERLGFGVSGPHGTILVPPEATIALINQAYHWGLRYFDTAPSYGGGEAEKRLGEALARLKPSDCVISTKAGIISIGATGKQRDFSPQSIRASLQASLKRLRRSHVDRLFLHGPASAELSDELIATLIDLREKGDIGALGICGVGKELDAAIATGQFAYYMTPIHAGLSSEAMARASRVREAGELIGIETLSLTRRSGLPLSAGSVWRFGRRVVGRARNIVRPSMSVEESLDWALRKGKAQSIVTTTTRLDHLKSTIDSMSARHVFDSNQDADRTSS